MTEAVVDKRSPDVGRDGNAWRKRTTWEVLIESAAADPTKLALITREDSGEERRVLYQELVERVATLSASLYEIGVRPGEVVATWLTSLVEYVYAFFAVQRLGATLAPISTRLKDSEAEFMLRTARAQHLILLDRFRKVDLEAAFTRICPEWPTSSAGGLHAAALPQLRNVIIVRRSDGTPSPRSFEFAQLLEAQNADARRRADAISSEVQTDALGLIKFTAGSTSFPKGAMLEQWGIVTNAMLHTERLGLTSADRFFNARPMFHAGGSIWGLMTMICRGGTLVFIEAWDAEAALDLIERERCTVNFGVAAMNNDMLDHLKSRPRDLRSLRLASVGNTVAGSWSAQDVERELGVDATFRAFGLTETYGPIALTVPSDTPERRSNTHGRLFDGVEVRVVDPDTGADVPPGEVGECLVRGLVMRGYFDLPKETAGAIDAEGWLHTQDLVRVDEERYLTFAGRLKAMIKVGGENVNVEEVEDCVRAFEGVTACCIVGVPDARKVEIGRAYVAVRSPGGFDVEALRSWVESQVALFKVPRDFVILDSLPTTGDTMKVDRRAIQAMARETG